MTVNDSERLCEAFKAGLLVRPSPVEPNLVDLFAGLAHFAGVPGLSPGPGSERLLSIIQPERRVLLVIADGVGTAALDDLPTTAFLRRHRVSDLRSIFPASTTSVMTSLATARWPCEHAAATWWVHLVERDLDVVTLPFTQRETNISLSKLGLRLEDLFPCPAVWPNAQHGFTAVLPAPLVATPFSLYSFGSHPQRAYLTLSDMVTQAAMAVQSASVPALVHAYLPQYDEAVHRHGAASQQARNVLEAIDHHLEELAGTVAGHARMVVTADHGMVDIPRDLWMAPALSDPLLDHLACAPSGEPRLALFHTKEGRAQVFAQEFRHRFGAHFLLLTPQEVESLHLLGPGPLSVATRSRLGTWLAIPLDRAGFLVRRNEFDQVPIVGMHGGMTPAEMVVPLVLA